LAGGAGYGKSEVTKALLYLAKSWGYAGSILTTAHTGIASVNVWGQTLHSLFKWSVALTEPIKKPFKDDILKFAVVKIIIIDEISMLDQCLFGRMDRCLRLLKDNELVLGGVHLIMVGDWLQQSPVQGTLLFQEPDLFADKDSVTVYKWKQSGYSIYQSINCVVNMTQNMRHSRNSASSSWFPALLSRLRYGQLTYEDMEKLNSVCYQPNITDSLESDSNLNNSFDAFCPFIVSSHKVRVELNHEMMNTWASTTSTPLFEFDALVYFKGVLVEGNLRNSLNLLWENKTGRLPMKLRLGLGMPMMCTVNMSPEFKLCNGSIGHIVYIHHHKSNRFSLFSD
jgi:hypothetical protein